MDKKLLLFLYIIFILSIQSALGSDLNDWADRDTWQEPERVMDVIGVKPGMVIGEPGAGKGYFTFKLSSRVGAAGKIYANDIYKSELSAIEKRCRRYGIKNIETIVGIQDDPLLPDGKMDMVVMVYVFHALKHPVKFLENLKADLKPGAPVVILDQDPEKTGDHHFPPHSTILKLIKESNYRVKQVHTFLKKDTIYIIEPNES